MAILIVGPILITLIVGLIVKLITDRIKSVHNITKKEFAITMAVISLIVVPGAVKLGWDMAKGNKTAYVEYINGWEQEAIEVVIPCEKDGICRYDYDCDPYTVVVSYSCNCDEDGNCDTCYDTETRYHSCPYVDEERSYYVQTSIGKFTIDTNRFPYDPQNRRWDKSERIPDYIIEQAGVGEPQFWLEVKKRLNKKLPGPVTGQQEYTNYIYASEQTILKQYSSEIEKFKKRNLLPRIQSGTRNFYFADKVYFVGSSNNQKEEWQKELNNFNAAFGMYLQGDLHLVIITDKDICQNPEEYALALKAYWQNTKEFGKNALGKNALVVIIGTSDKETVSWARAFTGMPMGNEELIVAINNLKGLQLKPEVIIGTTIIKIVNKKTMAEFREGVLQQIVFGLKDSGTIFKRISMEAKDDGDNGLGYLYLTSEIQPDKKQKVIIFIIVSIVCCLSWIVALIVGEENYRRHY